MKLEYLAQPDVQLGRLLTELVTSKPLPDEVILVSAFARLQSILRLKKAIADLRGNGTSVRIVLGIDLGGTSKEVLSELLTWDVENVLVKNRTPGHTFHPKLYFLRWKTKAELIVGSNNLTDGGWFRNYEAGVRATYELPADEEALGVALTQLSRFLNPTGSTAKLLSKKVLATLIRNRVVPSESEARRNTESASSRGMRQSHVDVFGGEYVTPPPPVPSDAIDGLLKQVRSQKAKKKPTKPSKKAIAEPTETFEATAFYMTLPTLQGANIPGEARIPLEAIELAEQFWGWPTEYKKEVTGKGNKRRVYWNWRPTWKIINAQNPAQSSSQTVRMYYYENSSDFRFYARPLVTAGGDLGDIVRIRRIADKDAQYECVLARQGTPEYDEWIEYCTKKVRNSSRSFGFA